MGFHPVTHVVFDMDGLLLDTESLYTKGSENICAKYGSKFTLEAKRASMGRVATEAAKIVIRACNLPISPQTYLEEFSAQYSVVFDRVDYMPGALELVEHFHGAGIPQAIATSSSRQLYDFKARTKKEAFERLFEHILTAGSDPEVKEGKPHPDTFLIAAQRFKTKPLDNKNVLVFEDSPMGVRAALAAGMQVIWVPDLRIVEDTNWDEPDLVIPSLEKFDPTLFNLPPLQV